MLPCLPKRPTKYSVNSLLLYVKGIHIQLPLLDAFCFKCSTVSKENSSKDYFLPFSAIVRPKELRKPDLQINLRLWDFLFIQNRITQRVGIYFRHIVTCSVNWTTPTNSLQLICLYIKYTLKVYTSVKLKLCEFMVSTKLRVWS